MQNLDKYFKEKLEGRQFEMKEAYWQHAEQLLAANERRRRRGLWLWWGGGALGLAALVALFFAFGKMGQGDVVAQQKNRAEISTAAPDETTAGSKAGAVLENDKADFENVKPTDNEGIGDKDLANAKKAKPAGQSQIAAEGHVVAVIKPATEIAPKGEGQGSVLLEKTGAGSMEGPQRETPEAAAGTGLGAENAGTETKTSSSEILTENTLSPASEENAPQVREAAPDELATLQIFVKNNSEENLQPTEAEYFTASKPWSLGFSAAQIFQPTPGSAEQSVIAFEAGVLLRRDLGKASGFYLRSGLNYQRRTGNFEQSKLAETRNYRFGLELDTNLLRPSALHTLSLPVLLGREKGRHIVEAGASLNYLTGVRGETGSYQRIEANPPRRDFVAQKSGWIVEDGFKKMTLAGQLNYRFRVNMQWSFGLSANYVFGGILEKTQADLPGLGVSLKEDDKLYFGLQAVYIIQR